MSSPAPTVTLTDTRQLPEWVPAIGSTVHLRTNGKRKPAVPFTIERYSVGSDGTWIFKAFDFAGWTHIDTVESLR